MLDWGPTCSVCRCFWAVILLALILFLLAGLLHVDVMMFSP